MTINGVIGLSDLLPIVRFNDTINAASTTALFGEIEAANKKAEKVYIICGNASYYLSKEVRAYLETSKVTLVFLPPCAPNLDLIGHY